MRKFMHKYTFYQSKNVEILPGHFLQALNSLFWRIPWLNNTSNTSDFSIPTKIWSHFTDYGRLQSNWRIGTKYAKWFG